MTDTAEPAIITPDAPEPRVMFDRDAEHGFAYQRGIDAFIAGAPVFNNDDARASGDPLDWEAGWHTAWARCYAMGVVAALKSDRDAEPANPFRTITGAEAWAEGFDAAAEVDNA